MKTITKLAAVSVGLLSLVGCSPSYGEHYQVLIDPEMSFTYQQDVLTAVSLWKNSIPLLDIEPTIAPCPGQRDGVICVHVVPQEIVDRIEGVSEENTNFNGVTSKPSVLVDGGISYISNRLFPIGGTYHQEQNLIKVATHEIGHAMGLEHLNEKHTSIMYWSIQGDTLEPTCLDVQQWMSLRGLSYNCPQ